MIITILTDDKSVALGGSPVPLPNLNWGAECFMGDPNSPHDDVGYVFFDTDRGVGHIAFKTVLTKQVLRPDFRPPDCPLTKSCFDELFAWILPIYEAEVARLKAEEEERADIAAQRAAIIKVREELKAQQAAEQAALTQEPGAGTEDIATLKVESAALMERLAAVEGDLKQLYDENKKVMTGET